MTNNIIITNPKKLEQTKEAMRVKGAPGLHFLTDFDRTLTKAVVNGEAVPSLISILRDENYLTIDYAASAHALFDKYHPMEIDPQKSVTEKKKAMLEWWNTHFELLIKCGLEKKDLAQAVQSPKIKLREGTRQLLDELKENIIPVVILSSAGVGGDGISIYLETQGVLSPNIYIVSNSYIWDERGRAVDIKKPIIHALNKDETILSQFPFYSKIKERKNVILLGDSLGDVEMITGFEYENLIKVGFLNDKIEENLETYQKNYDIIITDDGSMDEVYKLLKEIINNN